MDPVIETTVAPRTTSVVDRVQREPGWPVVTRIAFRFMFAYFVVYNFPFPLDLLPFTSSVLSRYDDLRHKIVPWVGSRVLHLNYPITVFPNGSGDTTYNYVQVLCFVVLAIIAAVVWSLLDRRRASYARLFQWFSLYIRLALGTAMIGYGAAKVIPTQMPPPGLSILTENYGASSPMRLLWTFMGASKGYEIFAGLSEMAGGLLLFIPRLATLGALLLVGVLSNVFLLNMCYDVPVKLYSFHLLLMAVFLLAPDMRRLCDLFLFRRTTQLSRRGPLFQRAWINRGFLALQLIFGLFVATTSLNASWQFYQQLNTKPPFYGMWSVENYLVNGNALSPAGSDGNRWRQIILDFPERLTVQRTNGSFQRFFLKLDQAKKIMELAKRDDPNSKTVLSYQNPEPNVLILQGDIDGNNVNVKARSVDVSKFPLTSRGFHWINEYPFNQ